MLIVDVYCILCIVYDWLMWLVTLGLWALASNGEPFMIIVVEYLRSFHSYIILIPSVQAYYVVWVLAYIAVWKVPSAAWLGCLVYLRISLARIWQYVLGTCLKEYDVNRRGTYLTPLYYHCDTDGYSLHNAWHCLHILVCILTIPSGPTGATSMQDGAAQFPQSWKAMYVLRQCYAYSWHSVTVNIENFMSAIWWTRSRHHDTATPHHEG